MNFKNWVKSIKTAGYNGTRSVFYTKNANISEKNMFLTIFVKKSFFFRVKKKIEGNFFVEMILPDESRDQIG